MSHRGSVTMSGMSHQGSIDDAAVAGATGDPRLVWLVKRAMQLLGSSTDLTAEWDGPEQARSEASAFLDKPGVNWLFFSMAGKCLSCSTRMPDKGTLPVAYFRKSSSCSTIRPETIVDQITCGAVAPGQALDQARIMCQHILLPLVTAPECATKNEWNSSAHAEVSDQARELLSTLCKLKGACDERTYLPIPIRAARVHCDVREEAQMFDAHVLAWSRQLDELLERESTTMDERLKASDPSVEVQFWSDRVASLGLVHDQLSTSDVHTIKDVLKEANSSFHDVLCQLIEDVSGSLSAARDIHNHLRPFVNIFKDVEDIQDFKLMAGKITLHMHYLYLAWTRSAAFNANPSRLIVLVAQFCNFIVSQGPSSFTEEVLAMDSCESIPRLQALEQVCRRVPVVFQQYKTKVASEHPDAPWNVSTAVMFEQLDLFLRRVRNILFIVTTRQQFSKLEAVVLGNSMGGDLSRTIQEIHEEYMDEVEQLETECNDVLDVNVTEFDMRFEGFHEKVEALEQRCASVLGHGLEDCMTVTGMIGLAEAMQPILARDSMKPVRDKIIDHVSKFWLDDMLMVHNEYLAFCNNPPCPNNMAPVSGALTWCRGLKQRIQEPEKQFFSLVSSMGAGHMETAQEAYKLLRRLRRTFEQFEKTSYLGWANDVENSVQEKLCKSLLRVGSDKGRLEVNFDPSLERLLREVKYFLAMKLDIPEVAMSIYGRAEIFRTQIANLELIVSNHNSIASSLLDVERPLLTAALEEIHVTLKKGLRGRLTWNGPGVEDFIKISLGLTSAACSKLSQLKANMQTIEGMLETWSQKPQLKRSKSRTYTVKEFQDEHGELCSAIRDEFERSNLQIQKLLHDSNRALKIPKTTPAWGAYVEFLSTTVSASVCKILACSLRHLLAQLDPQMMAMSETQPLLQVNLVLALLPHSSESEDRAKLAITFDPELCTSGGNAPGQSAEGLVEQWIAGFMENCSHIKRLDRPGVSYIDGVRQSEEVIGILGRIDEVLKTCWSECRGYKETFGKYRHLWEDDVNEGLQNFLRQDQPEQASECFVDFSSEPSLDLFEAELSQYHRLKESASDLPGTYDVGWVQIHLHPLKDQIKFHASKWICTFADHLAKRVIDSVARLDGFCSNIWAVLEAKGAETDTAMLTKALSAIQKVHRVSGAVDAVFDPLKSTVAILDRAGHPLTDSDRQGLVDLPAKWEKLKADCIATKAMLKDPLEAEATRVRKMSTVFTETVTEMRRDIRTRLPTHIKMGQEDAVSCLDDLEELLSKVAQEKVLLNEKEDLYEVGCTAWHEIEDSIGDCQLLRQCWTMVGEVTGDIEGWKLISWDGIDADNLVATAKQLQKRVKSLPQPARLFNVFDGLMEYVKNVLTALPLIQELHDDAVQRRHWNQLMQVAGVRITIDDKFTLGSVMGLHLHNYQEQVLQVVDQARQELKIEKQLKRIEDTWKDISLEYEEWGSVIERAKKPFVLKPADDVVETLEDHLVTLQNMAANKYVAQFEKEVTGWKEDLSNLDYFLNLWIEVQRSWQSLESIFLLSEDIRQQLKEDADRFVLIDNKWVDMMDTLRKTNSILEVVTEDRKQLLETLQGMLELCEKSLSEYLDVKRMAFPRFYFMSRSDLIDILSKGSYPQQVQRHLSALFSAMGRLKFAGAEDEPTGRTAIGAWATDGEWFEFDKPMVCEGQVETWLSKLLDVQRSSLRSKIMKAIEEYPSKPKQEWVLEHCSQAALTASQVWWTRDVMDAFEKMEEGQPTALKDYLKRHQEGLKALTELAVGDLSKDDRRKVVTMITIEVHARDVVQRLIDDKIDNASAFAWQSQLRYFTDNGNVRVNIADASFDYGYEWVGNCSRLVITPLTDRCYITLTQALRLILGGAPAGPAGTGKTETVKDLGRALGFMVYVFNCSGEMTFESMGQIFSGLCQTGAWGCFDEFNRISIEVLSVVAAQYDSILSALRAKKQTFDFMGQNIKLVPSMGAFITMNPGYKGRTELPENIKALFRPVAMVVPDLENICEIMLQAEGFVEAKTLAHKFVVLYQLNKELLSAQDHYDWGLRAVKSVLVVAGNLKRSDPDLPEDAILMRALRDFNLPKIVDADVPIFTGLLNDLFPSINPPRKVDKRLEEAVRDVIREEGSGLQEVDMFVLKVVQLAELLEVRHSVFIIGPPGCGKTSVWKTLAAAQARLGQKTVSHVLNPKAVSTADLYGYIHPVTKEYKDGIMATTMRKLSRSPGDHPKWIVLDGDIDAEWIESMNTVMDDNKVLTLVSNERITLTSSMRLIFEIGDLRNATPATVSRAGILFINDTDIGWRPVTQSWCQRVGQGVQGRPEELMALFDKYVPPCLDMIRGKQLKHVVDMNDTHLTQTVCNVFEALLEQTSSGSISGNLSISDAEARFVFAAVWGLAGSLTSDQSDNHRQIFSDWWRQEFAQSETNLPDEGMVWDYFWDSSGMQWRKWDSVVPQHEFDAGAQVHETFVQTIETVRLNFMIDLFIKLGKPVMLVGNTGTGKSALMHNQLNKSLDRDKFMTTTINFNASTDASSLQDMVDQPLEKKAGTMYGPPANKKLVYFVDDLNMSLPDKWGTQSSIALLRQIVDNGSYYDLQKLMPRQVSGIQFVACMNPTSGSFTVDPRLQRHFAVFSCPVPTPDSVESIFAPIIREHVAQQAGEMKSLSDQLLGATIELSQTVAETFRPSALKFHYQFDLRAVSSVVQGLMHSTSANFKDVKSFARLWAHECCRVYGDRLVSDADAAAFRDILIKTLKQHFEEEDQDGLLAEPLLFSTMTKSGENSDYLPVTDWGHLKKVLDAKLDEYNESYANMDLVLFEQAMEHLCRIVRVLDQPGGNALLIGVGGSGKQSLARLASFICGHEVYQITVAQNFSIQEFKEHLVTLYTKTGIKDISVVFLLTDQQIVTEDILVFINDILSSGECPTLYTPEEKDAVINSIRGEVKQHGGIEATNENCWKYFISKVRRNLHIVLCFSPVGNDIRVRCRRYPAVVNSTTIDWFHPWPTSALSSVAARFLADESIPMESDEIREAVASHMAYVHQSATETCQDYRLQEKRYNYTTPKTFLELIDLYKKTFKDKLDDIMAVRERLSNGLEKLQESSSQVSVMQSRLKEEQVEVEKKRAITDELLLRVGEEASKADAAASAAAVDEKRISAKAKEVEAFEIQCRSDLEAAEPAVQAAMEALSTLDKSALGVLKTLGKPPEDVQDVAAAVAYLFAPPNTDLKKMDVSWSTVKTKLMGSLPGFMSALQNFDKDNIPPENRKMVENKFMNKKSFDPESIKTKSQAASGLCAWVRNIVLYNQIYLDVKPKRIKLAQSQEELALSRQQLEEVQQKVKELQDRKEALKHELHEASQEKARLELKAETTQKRLALAERLVNGLKDENVRWSQGLAELDVKSKTLVGDVLLSSSFIAYIGAFSKAFRLQLLTERWVPDIESKLIPLSANVEVLSILADDAQIAAWGNEGLPSDPVSLQNAAIVTNSTRWPLLIDPQLQALKWLKKKEEPFGLRVVQPSQRNYLNIVQNAMENGLPCLIENIGETIDAVLEPLLSRAVIKRGTTQYVKIGDTEVELDPKFRLYIHTRLPNPHYRPEVAAQTTLVNFTVTEQGLQDQLLAVVVNKEKAELEQRRLNLVRELNEYSISLKQLEDDLLKKLSESKGDILSDEALIVGLETTKKTASEIALKQAEARKTEAIINQSRNFFVPAAARGALLYFLVSDLRNVDHMYQFSLSAFMDIYSKALDKSAPSKDEQQRLANIVDSVTLTVFKYVTRCLYERHRLIFTSRLALKVALSDGKLPGDKIQHLLSGKKNVDAENPLNDWLPDDTWAAVTALTAFESFSSLPDDIVSAPKRWREWIDCEAPEDQPLPADWKKSSVMDKLLILRALRPDRVAKSVKQLISSILGTDYVQAVPFDLEESLTDASPEVPVFFFLSSGVDPLGDVKTLAIKRGMIADKIHAVSLGQGQEKFAEAALDKAQANGEWVVLQNIELASKWLINLENRLAGLGNCDPSFQIFLTAQPSDRVPVGILQSCIKLTNEPPQGLKANMLRAFNTFGEAVWEQCPKQNELKQILFPLCFFHTVVVERRKFGPQGWNRTYPFNQGDLSVCIQVLSNYLDTCSKIPWDDIRYIFGEIMYGGHITDDWDRRLCSTYLAHYIRPQLVEAGITLFPGFDTPGPMSHDTYIELIESSFTRDTPDAFGLHPNAEIGFNTTQGEVLCGTILSLEGEGSTQTSGASLHTEAVDGVKSRMPSELELDGQGGVWARLPEGEKCPFTNVFLQECERMNRLLAQMRRSLDELILGLKGELTISDDMETLMAALLADQVPESWAKMAYPSTRGLGSWLGDLARRHAQLAGWCQDLVLPRVIWLPGFFNPQSFLTAVMQVTARKNKWPLDRMLIQTEPVKQTVEQLMSSEAPTNGAYVHGLYCEGAKWDIQAQHLSDMQLKELSPMMPPMLIRPVLTEDAKVKDKYMCPVYKTRERGHTHVFTAALKTKAPAAKWVMAGVALILDVGS